ncbi:formin-J [Topomyia yanbarensis]|uniref:formin-J n=1 Tax=Topomyia yanbarensis TaxID=2498891 RepID=UPI00273BB9BC|nr:formin-J [Topomyia yanbarensis]
MSTSRYLNWSRPSPGRHPLRKQMSCFESFSSGSGRSLSVNNLAPVSGDKSVDFATFVTAAIIHTNRFQNYPTYHQARRGDGSGTPTFSSGSPTVTVARRPASAHTTPAPSSSSSLSSGSSSSSGMARKMNENRKVFSKQLSLDNSMLIGAGPAAGHAWTTSSSRAPSIDVTGPVARDHEQSVSHQNPKSGTISGVKKRPPGISVKNDTEQSERTKKTLKQDKDSRINIKIFLGQTVQQDSSDNGISDTECSTIQPNAPSNNDQQQQQPLPQQQQQKHQTGNQKTEAENSHPEGENKPKSTPSPASSSNGRGSSLAQRRAQFQASRQNQSEATERRPPLVRAMSAPNRPIEDNSKFLQNKKKTRKKKVLRERDEINECDEDDFEEADSVNLTSANNKNPVLGPRSRSVIGGTACDIETLVSLLSSGGSDSEKEDSTTGTDFSGVSTNSNIIGSSLKSRAPMLKKAGKSVSFQETELKQSAGLNRDYYTAAHRKPPSLQPIANRIRRSQQLANSLNAFHLKDIKKSSSDDSKSDEDKGHPNGNYEDKEMSSNLASPVQKPPTAVVASGQELGDGQTPKERECYRLFQKMSNMGLSVSYDTILRGMLTPTELRVLQKQRSKLQKQQESRQSSSETENNDGSSEASKSHESTNMSSSQCDRMELEVTSEQVVTELQQVTGQ